MYNVIIKADDLRVSVANQTRKVISFPDSLRRRVPTEHECKAFHGGKAAIRFKHPVKIYPIRKIIYSEKKLFLNWLSCFSTLPGDLSHDVNDANCKFPFPRLQRHERLEAGEISLLYQSTFWRSVPNWKKGEPLAMMHRFCTNTRNCLIIWLAAEVGGYFTFRDYLKDLRSYIFDCIVNFHEKGGPALAHGTM